MAAAVKDAKKFIPQSSIIMLDSMLRIAMRLAFTYLDNILHRRTQVIFIGRLDSCVNDHIKVRASIAASLTHTFDRIVNVIRAYDT